MPSKGVRKAIGTEGMSTVAADRKQAKPPEYRGGPDQIAEWWPVIYVVMPFGNLVATWCPALAWMNGRCWWTHTTRVWDLPEDWVIIPPPPPPAPPSDDSSPWPPSTPNNSGEPDWAWLSGSSSSTTSPSQYGTAQAVQTAIFEVMRQQVEIRELRQDGRCTTISKEFATSYTMTKQEAASEGHVETIFANLQACLEDEERKNLRLKNEIDSLSKQLAEVNVEPERDWSRLWHSGEQLKVAKDACYLDSIPEDLATRPTREHFVRSRSQSPSRCLSYSATLGSDANDGQERAIQYNGTTHQRNRWNRRQLEHHV